MRSRIDPMRAVAKTLRAHRALILHWFRVREAISLGAIEGLNNKLEVVTRRAFGFRSAHVVKVALYHTLGALPEPEGTHTFCRGGCRRGTPLWRGSLAGWSGRPAHRVEATGS